jgi:hypothetical protein
LVVVWLKKQNTHDPGFEGSKSRIKTREREKTYSAYTEAIF